MMIDHHTDARRVEVLGDGTQAQRRIGMGTEAYRQQQVAHLLRSIVAVHVDTLPQLESPVRAFVSITAARDDVEEDDGKERGSYTSIAEAVRVVDYRAQLVDPRCAIWFRIGFAISFWPIWPDGTRR